MLFLMIYWRTIESFLMEFWCSTGLLKNMGCFHPTFSSGEAAPARRLELWASKPKGSDKASVCTALPHGFSEVTAIGEAQKMFFYVRDSEGPQIIEKYWKTSTTRFSMRISGYEKRNIWRPGDWNVGQKPVSKVAKRNVATWGSFPIQGAEICLPKPASAWIVLRAFRGFCLFWLRPNCLSVSDVPISFEKKWELRSTEENRSIWESPHRNYHLKKFSGRMFFSACPPTSSWSSCGSETKDAAWRDMPGATSDAA